MKKRRWGSYGLLAIGVVTSVGLGCNTQRGWPDRSAGALGYAEFCDADSDEIDIWGDIDEEVCVQLGSDYAVGGRLRVRTRLSDALPDAVEDNGVSSASPEYLDDTGLGLIALQEGQVAVMARGTREVVDYVMLTLRNVDAIVVVRPELPPVGQAFAVSAIPMGDGIELAGELDYVWVSQSEGLEVVSDEAGHGQARLRLTTPDEVTLEVSAGGHTQRVTFAGYAGPRREPGADPEPSPPGLPAPGGFNPDSRPPTGAAAQ